MGIAAGHKNTIAFLAILILFVCGYDAPAGTPIDDFSGNRMLDDRHRNYFLKDSDLKTWQMVRNVNKLHLKPALDHLTKGKPKNAIPELNFVLRYVPNHPKALQLMGVVTRLTGRPKVGEQYFAQAIRVYPDHALTHAQFGNFLIELGRIEEGIERLETARSIQPDMTMVYLWLAEAYHKHGDLEKEREAKGQAQELKKQKAKLSKP